MNKLCKKCEGQLKQLYSSVFWDYQHWIHCHHETEPIEKCWCENHKIIYWARDSIYDMEIAKCCPECGKELMERLK